MKTFASVMLCAATSATVLTSGDYKFMRFVTEHGKNYGTVEEFEARKEIFLVVDEQIAKINSNPDSLMIAGHNKFSDRSYDEMRALNTLDEIPVPAYRGEPMEITNDDLPTSVDWRDEGVVTPVKDQGSCGSCWAFSSTGALESAYAIKTGNLTVLSEQQLVDCAGKKYGNHGCYGGWYYNSYDYLADTHMLETENQYPYMAKNENCMEAGDGKVTDQSYVSVTPNMTGIKTAIAQQPVNVAVAAGNTVFQAYTSGIITAYDNCPTNIDHAILAVGYGIDADNNDMEYLIVKNSWGAAWGEEGYVRIQLIDTPIGVCGINQYVAYPVL